MPNTQVNCPNCRQPIVADITRLFDVGQNPQAKQMILSGGFNIAQCPHCGYRGNIASPLVYHDPDKELLLTFFPPEMGMPVNEQERIIGPLVNQAMNNLPSEKRKGYLFQPQTMLTLQGLLERILEADGITKEMLDEQQKRLGLVSRLLDASDETIEDIIKTEDSLLDADFFAIFSQLLQATASSDDQETRQKMAWLQEKLLNFSTYGGQVKSQSDEFEAAVKSLEALGQNLTREKLLDLLIEAPNETRMSVIVSLTRPGIDYEFFQLLSERIDRASGEDREKLLALRESLLEITQTIDQAVETRKTQAVENLNQILATENISETMQTNLSGVDEYFVQAVSDELEKARKAGDLERIDKIRQVDLVLQQAMKPPKEVEVIQELLAMESEAEQSRFFETNSDALTAEFMETLGSVMAQMQSQEDKELAARVENLYRLALRFSMKMNL